MSSIRLLVITLALVSSFVTNACATDEVAPGLKSDIKAGATAYTYKLFTPKRYAELPQKLFPVVYIQMPWAKPDIMGLGPWADDHDVVIVCIDDSCNEVGDDIVGPAQDAVWKAVEASVRCHPLLHFGIGFSGGAGRTCMLARKHIDQFAGLVIEGKAGDSGSMPKSMTVGFVYGDTDFNRASLDAAYDSLVSQGNHVNRSIFEGGHVCPAFTLYQPMLAWVVQVAGLTLPKLSPADRKEAEQQVVGQIAAAAAITDLADRRQRLDALMALPDMMKHPFAKDLAAAWRAASVAAADASADTVTKHQALSELSVDPRMAGSAEAKAIASDLATLRKDPAIKKEWSALKPLLQLRALEAAAGENAQKRKDVVQGYLDLAKRFGDTVAAKQAADSAERLKKAWK